ncbi:MAG TPA: LON peptidase substrate-binding domain-containing protein [Actinomycetes bacterium]|nr:LON peptidase substrate-binding domain-containing protein [Actinomycetes bacterium]
MELPLFPLSTVLYPGLPIPLHVFEERYREMFARILDSDQRFGVVAIVEGFEVGGAATYHPVGCLAEVREVRPYPDGRLDVVAQGASRFEIGGVVQPRPYIVAEVTTLPEEAGEDAERHAKRAGRLFTRYVSALLELAGEDGGEFEVPADPLPASYFVAAGLQIDVADKQRLLIAPTAAERLQASTILLRRELALLERLQAAGPARMTGPFSLN